MNNKYLSAKELVARLNELIAENNGNDLIVSVDTQDGADYGVCREDVVIRRWSYEGKDFEEIHIG